MQIYQQVLKPSLLTKMWHALLTLLLIESQITWTVASSVDFPLDGHSNSGQDDLEEGSYSRTAHQDDHNRQTQNRHENTNVKDKWQESRERIQKLQELQDKFADVQVLVHHTILFIMLICY